jgi:hypothetical protein
MRRLTLATVAASLVMLVVPPSAMADDTRCVGPLTGVHDNVVVPEGSVCLLTGAVVRGNIKVLQDASLSSFNNEVGGNIEGDKAANVGIFGNRVGGNIDLVEVRGPGQVIQNFNVKIFICASTLSDGDVKITKGVGTVAVGAPLAGCPGNVIEKGSIQVEDTFVPPGEALAIQANEVAEDLQVFKNTGAGLKLVQFNTVGENLQCFENDPPFLGQPNVAEQAQGQCGQP